MRTLLGLLIAATVSGSTAADDAAAIKELTPTGKLRVAIAYGPTASALYVLKDPAAPGGFRGVTIDLSNALAKKIGTPLELKPYLASGEIQAAASTGVWDVSFMPVDEE